MISLHVRIWEQQTLVFEATLPAGVVEIGRQKDEERGYYRVVPADGLTRLVIAPLLEHSLHRILLRLEPLSGDQVRVINPNAEPVQGAGLVLLPKEDKCLPLPFTLVLSGDTPEAHALGLPQRTLEFTPGEPAAQYSVRLLASRPLPPGLATDRGPADLVLPGGSRFGQEDLKGWLQRTLRVLRRTIGGDDFLQGAVQAMVEIVGLHAGRLLLRAGDRWPVVAQHVIRGREGPWQPSKQVLDLLCREQRTQVLYCQPGTADQRGTTSLEGLDIVIASPLLDTADQIKGVLYGERGYYGPGAGKIGEVAPLQVELLACAVSVGLARQDHEQAAARYAQFFPQRLGEQLRVDADLLKGREMPLTLLFCDIRGFTRHGGSLPRDEFVKLAQAVQEELARCVAKHDGTVVDFIGDELFAMWGAPQEQPDHAIRAVCAALDILDALQGLKAAWDGRLKEPLELGIGLHCGLLYVGNIGASDKAKYGPRGQEVNVASRVQGMTKHLFCRLLVTAAVIDELKQHKQLWAVDEPAGQFIARRVCWAKMVGVEDATRLYEVAAAEETLRQFFEDSEKALYRLETKQFDSAIELASSLRQRHLNDGPLRVVIQRASQGLDPTVDFQLIWVPPGK